MRGRFRFPIRLKILITLLLVVTAVVSVITFTMARLFHEDKKAYVHDLSTLAATSTAEESRVVLTGFGSRLAVCSRILGRGDVSGGGRSTLIEGVFEDFPELVAVWLYRGGREVASAFDEKALEGTGVVRADLERYGKEWRNPAAASGSGRLGVRVASLADTLPVLELSMGQGDAGGGERTVLLALVKQDALRRICSRSRVFETYIVTADGTVVAGPVLSRPEGRTRLVIPEGARPAAAEFVAARSVEFSDRGRDVIGAFASIEVADLTAVALVPASAAFLASRELLRGLIGVALMLLALAAAVSLIWSRRMTRPIERLSRATEKIGHGQFDVTVDVESADEIGALAASINRMASELDHRESALKEAQGQLVQSEKMAAFGLLGAGIAHEVKNPLAGILGCAQISLRRAEPGSIVHQNLELIEKETKRCKTIIENLLRFARQEKAAFEDLDVNRPVAEAIAIVHHQLELGRVKLTCRLGEGLPAVRGNANQLQQVLMNLLINAQQAMQDGGNVVVSTAALDGSRVLISIADDGPGIPDEIKGRIFEPFFTTKPNGKGTGLGLSVSYGIVKDHGGEIAVESEAGRGTVFAIVLPARADGPPLVGISVDQTETDLKASV